MMLSTHAGEKKTESRLWVQKRRKVKNHSSRHDLSFCVVLSSLLIAGPLQVEPQPDNTEHELQVAAINEDIKKIKDQIEIFRSKIDEANEARRGQGVSSFVFVVVVVDLCVVPLFSCLGAKKERGGYHRLRPFLLGDTYPACLFVVASVATGYNHF